MKNNCPSYYLGDILINRNESPDEFKVTIGEIPIVSKIGFNESKIELRTDGVSKTKLICVYPNDLIISGINVEKGAVSINEFGKQIAATIHYSAYYPDSQMVDIKYLWFYLRSNDFKYYLKQSFPIGIKTEVKPEKFLKIKIPLPKLSEQKKIVTKILHVKNKKDEIQFLRGQQEKEIRAIKFSIYSDAQTNFRKQKFSSFLYPSENVVEPELYNNYRQVGVRWWGGGAYERETINGSQTSYKSFIHLDKNDLIFNKIWVRNGALAIVKDNAVGCFASSEFPVFKYNIKEVNSQWIDFVINLPTFWEQCSLLSQGTSGKNRIKPNEFLNIDIPIPPIEEQTRIVSLLEKLNEVKANLEQIEKELAELLPALLDNAFKGKL